MTNDKNWKPCPPGTIEALVSHQTSSNRVQKITRRAVFTMVASVGAGISYAMWTRARGIKVLTCSQTVALAQRFVLGQLSAEETSAVEAHCRKCEKCTNYIDVLRERTA